MERKDEYSYDITIVKKLGEKEYKVYCIYPNEETEERTPVLWESHHTWDGEGSLHEWYTYIEQSAYLNEEFKSYYDILDELNTEFVWYNNEEDIDAHLSELKIGQSAICKYSSNYGQLKEPSVENETRYIILHDCETDLYVETNAPSKEIENAILERNRYLEKDLPFSSDFEIMQEYLQNKGYSFEHIYTNEWYNW